MLYFPQASDVIKTMALSLETRIFLSSICVIVFAVGSFLNIALVFVLIRFRENRTRISSIYLLSLSMSQILACLYEAPYYSLSLSLTLPPRPQDRYRLACKISIFITYFLSAVKIFNLTIMSLDRYVAIIFPFTYERHATKRTAMLSIAFVWIFPLALTSPLLIISNWTDYEGRCGYACGLQFHKTAVVYTVIAGLLVIPGPLIIMMITNIRVFLAARQQQLRINNARFKMDRRSIGETLQCHEGALTQYSELGKDPAADNSSPSLENGNQGCFGILQRKLNTTSNSKIPRKSAEKHAASFSYVSTNFGKANAGGKTHDEAKSNANITEVPSETTNTSSTELRNKRDNIGYNADGGSGNNAEYNQQNEEARGTLRSGKSAYFCNCSNGDDAVCSSCKSSVDTVKGEEPEEYHHTVSQETVCSPVITKSETSTVHPVQEVRSDKPLDSFAAALSASVENEAATDRGLDTSFRSKRSKSSFLNFFEKRKERKSMNSLGSESSFSWNIASSTLLMVLAFFITYIPFLVTRFTITNDSPELSDEVVTYTALLTTLGNLINPGIVLSTRRKLKADFMRIVCCRQRPAVD